MVAYRQPVTGPGQRGARGERRRGDPHPGGARVDHRGGHDTDTGATTFATTELFLERLGLSSLTDLPDIAPLLPDVDVIDDPSETWTASHVSPSCPARRRASSTSPSMSTVTPMAEPDGHPVAEGAVAGRDCVAPGGRTDDPRRPRRGRRACRHRDGHQGGSGDRGDPGGRGPDRARRHDGLSGGEQAARDALHDVGRPRPALHRRPGGASGAGQQEVVPRRSPDADTEGVLLHQRRRTGAPADASLLRGAQDPPGHGDRSVPRGLGKTLRPASNSTTGRSRSTISPSSTRCPARRWCG